MPVAFTIIWPAAWLGVLPRRFGYPDDVTVAPDTAGTSRSVSRCTARWRPSLWLAHCYDA